MCFFCTLIIDKQIMDLFRFAEPAFLYLLLLIVPFVILWIVGSRKIGSAFRSFGDEKLLKGLRPDYSSSRPNIKMLFMLVAFVFIVITLARPQFGARLEETKKEGVEVIIALDVSNSMLAEDIQPNRLERAKQALSRLVETFTNDKVGLIVFAGNAYVQIPITTDYISAKMFLSTISPDIVPTQGTAIGSAINLAMNSFSTGDNRSKSMIIITDGENHEDDAIALAKRAAEAGIVIHTIGIGSANGVPIQITTNGTTDYLKDREGNTVITKLDETILQQIAMTTGGSYVRANNTNIGLEDIYNNIRNMEQQELGSTIYTEYNDQYQIFAAIALLFLIVEFFIMTRKNHKLSKIKLFDIK